MASKYFEEYSFKKQKVEMINNNSRNAKFSQFPFLNWKNEGKAREPYQKPKQRKELKLLRKMKRKGESESSLFLKN